MAFQSFKQVGQRDTPNLIGAQIADDRMDEEQRQRQIAMMGKLAQGGAGLYNEAMGDSTPIADYLGFSEPTGEFAGGAMDYALPEAGATSGVNTAALTEALRAPEMASAVGDFAMTPDVLAGFAPEAGATAGMNLGAALAPEAAAGLGTALAPAATAGMNASTIGAALAPAAAEVGLGGAAAGAAGTALPPLGIALALGSLFGLFG